MNILLLGNGYDLHYKLPTSYHNFLLTLDFLIHSNIKNINNVGDVFGNSKLNKQDDCIKSSYELYKDVYDKVKLDQEKLQEMIDRTKNNVWFTYLIKSFNKDVGWIDFEKEIAYIIDCFKRFFQIASVNFSNNSKQLFLEIKNELANDKELKYIILKMFNFFLHPDCLSYGTIKSEYTCEYPLKSGNFTIDKKKIVDYLYSQLRDLAEVLKTYLHLFIDKTTELLCAPSSEESSKQPKISQINILNNYQVVITFNYTHTYELLSKNVDNLFHIHGEIDKEIVLGVNSDKNDKKETVDTSFLRFKKYYQRTYYETDCSYLSWIRAFREKMKKYNDETVSENIKLSIMGHSLDVTDENCIRELFGLATSIMVFHHDDTAKKQHIENLVNIFGNDEFEKLRIEKQLSFVNL